MSVEETFARVVGGHTRRRSGSTPSAASRMQARRSGAGSRETAHVQRMLSKKVAETTVVIARPPAKKTVGPHRVTMLLAGVVTVRSAALRNRRLQPGGAREAVLGKGVETLGPPQREMAVMLAAPPGEMMFRA